MNERQKKIAELIAKMEAIQNKAKSENREPTAEEWTEYESAADEADRLQTEDETETRRKSATLKAETLAERRKQSAGRVTPATVASPHIEVVERDNRDLGGDAKSETRVIPEGRRYYGSVKNFSGASKDAAHEKAYRFGMFCLGHLFNRPKALEWCSRHGIQAGQTINDNLAGGVTVPEEFSNDLIDLREQYGVFRRNAKLVPMMSDTKITLRRQSGLTAYAVGEAVAATASTKQWNQVRLTARAVAVLAFYSNELSEDSVINIGDDLAGEIAYAQALWEDSAGFNGDGTSTYHGITGVRSKLAGLSGTVANIAGLQEATGNLWSEITRRDLNLLAGRLPEYADGPRCKFYCSRAFWSGVLEALIVAQGGSTSTDLASKQVRRFMGYDVEVTQAMPRVEANSQICLLFGDLSLAADFGERGVNALAVSSDATIDGVSMFQTRQTAILGSERIDINVHDVGNASATAADRVAGPIVGLITAAA